MLKTNFFSSKDKTTTGEGAVRSQFLFLSFFVSTIFLKEKSTGGGMRRWEKGQRLTLGASWGSHGEESGSVTLAADMDNCLQAHSTLHIVLNLHHSAK